MRDKMNEKEDLDRTRYKEHYQKLLDAVRTRNFYTAIHEAQECIIYRKRDKRVNVNMNSEWVNPYSEDETSLAIQLREEGLIGQRLTDKFRTVYPDRSHRSVLNKVDQLRRKKIIKR